MQVLYEITNSTDQTKVRSRIIEDCLNQVYVIYEDHIIIDLEKKSKIQMIEILEVL